MLSLLEEELKRRAGQNLKQQVGLVEMTRKGAEGLTAYCKRVPIVKGRKVLSKGDQPQGTKAVNVFGG